MIGDFDAHFRFGADGEATTEMSLDSHARRQFAVNCIEDRDSDQQQVISECEPSQQRAVP